MSSSVIYERALPYARIVRDEFGAAPIVLWLSGEIDADAATALATELAGLLERRRRGVRVDTHAVTFLNSAALGVLAEAHAEWLAIRGTLVLCGVAGTTARLLHLTGLDRELLSMPPVADPLRVRPLVASG